MHGCADTMVMLLVSEAATITLHLSVTGLCYINRPALHTAFSLIWYLVYYILTSLR